MSPYQGPELLASSHDVGRFDCGNESLNRWLKLRVPRNQREGSNRTWVVTDGTGVVGFYASATAVVARNQPDPLPAMLLGRLAVDRNHQGKGLAAALLKRFLLKALEVAELTGLRLLLVPEFGVVGVFAQSQAQPQSLDNITAQCLRLDPVHETLAHCDPLASRPNT